MLPFKPVLGNTPLLIVSSVFFVVESPVVGVPLSCELPPFDFPSLSVLSLSFEFPPLLVFPLSFEFPPLSVFPLSFEFPLSSSVIDFSTTFIVISAPVDVYSLSKSATCISFN